MTDTNMFADLIPQQSADGANMFADLMPKAPSDADNDFLGRTARYARQGMRDINSSYDNMGREASNPSYSPLENAMGMVGGAFNTVASPISAAIQPLMKGAISTGAEQFVKDPDVLKAMQVEENLPGSQFNQGVDTLSQATSALVPMAAPFAVEKAVLAKKGLDGLAEQYAAKYPNAPVQKIAPPKPVFSPEDAHTGISTNYEAAKNTSGKYFDFSRQLAEGKNVKDMGLRNSLDDVISDIENSPVPHEGNLTIRDLKQMRDNISDDGTMPLQTAVELKQYLNSQFNPKRFMQSADNPYYQASKTTDKILTKAGETYTDFGIANKLANRNWLNTVEKPFQNNPVLNKFWQPEDYYAHKGVQSGMLDEIPDATKLRQESLLKNIKNPTQLDAVTRVMSEDQAQAIRAAKFDELRKGANTSRLSAFGNALKEVPNIVPHPLIGTKNVLTNLGEAIGGPTISAEKAALLKATKQPSPRLSSDYADQFNELKAYAGKSRMSVLGPKELPAPPEMLALPQPQRPLVGGRGKSPRPVTDDEWQQLIDLDNKSKEIGLSADVRKAQQDALISQYERSNPANNFFNKIGDKPLRINQTALNPESVGLDENPFSKGGPVKKSERMATDNPQIYKMMSVK